MTDKERKEWLEWLEWIDNPLQDEFYGDLRPMFNSVDAELNSLRVALGTSRMQLVEENAALRKRMERLERVREAAEAVGKNRPKIPRSLSPYVMFDIALDELDNAFREVCRNDET